MKLMISLPDDHFPKFDVGDPVVIFDPYAKNDGWIFDDMDAPKHGTIKRLAYVDHLGIFAYQLEEYSGWYNEAWLHDDEYLPLMVDVNVDRLAEQKRKARAEQIDNLLDMREWYRKALERTNDEAYGDRIMAIDCELRKLTETQ